MALSKITAASITDNTITNTQINSSAAIAKAKLASLDIVNADINASAAIAATKIGTIAAANMPSGSVVQMLQGYTKVNNENVTWNVSATGSSLYSTGINDRTYVSARAITFTPKFSNSILVCNGFIGWSSGNTGNTGAFGGIITYNDTTPMEISDYPWYNSGSAGPGSYPMAGIVCGTMTLSSASQCVIRLRPFGYAESGTITMRYKGHFLTVMEIKA